MATALFFDLDGTLANSERHHWRAWRDTLRPFHVRLSWQWYRSAGIGIPDAEVVRPILKLIRQGGTEVKQEELLKLKEKHFLRLIQTFSMVSIRTVNLLEHICNFPLAVVTSSPRVQADAILERAGVAQHFRTLVSLEDVCRPKPHPEPYLKAMKSLRVTAGIAFEDSKSGVASAQGAGLDVVFVPHPRQLPALVRARLARE
jgi:HAD superfamily hydrolase (TIGR01509 family)